MGTSRSEISEWLESGKVQGATHMIVATDTFDWEDYPVYVMPGEDVNKKIAKYSNPNEMSKVMEVYSYALPLENQLNENRAWNL